MVGIDVVYIIAVGALLLVILMSGAAFVLILREARLRGQGPGPGHVQTDLTNMMILFQTMRDVLSEQKDLARTFNANVDTKMMEVRTLLEEARLEREELQATQRHLMGAVDAAGDRVKALERQVSGEDAEAGPVTVAPRETEAPAQDPPASEADVETAPLDSVAEPASEIPTPKSGIAAPDWETAPSDSEVTAPDDVALTEAPVKLSEDASDEEPVQPAQDEVTDTWTGLDFGGDESDPLSSLLEEAPAAEPQVPEEVPETPQDAEAAREAFRTLLDLGDPAPAVGTTPASGEAEASSSDNGKTHGVRIRRRVYEYSDAGMSVSDIARELGVGKGEVRLMLSLRKDEEA